MRKITAIFIFPLTLCLLSGCTRRPDATHAYKKESTSEERKPQRPLKKIEQMNLDEAREAAAYFRDLQNEPKLAMALERVIILTSNTDELAVLMRELALLHENLENHEEAGTVYEQYTKLFPGNPDVNHMTYKMLEILRKQIQDVVHDQSKIKQLAEQSDIFLGRFGAKDPYAKRVDVLRTQSYQLWTKSELARAQFYLDRYAYTSKPSALNAAGKRLEEAERILANLTYKETDEQAVEKIMDTIRVSNFESLSDDEKIRRIQEAIAIIAPVIGEESEKKDTMSSFFKRLF